MTKTMKTKTWYERIEKRTAKILAKIKGAKQ